MVIYSGNKRKNGGMLRTQYSIEKNEKTNRSEISFFWTIQQQTDYNEKTERPVFKDGKTKTVKFNKQEIGAMLTTFLSSISNGKITSWSGFHDSKDKIGISFSYYHKEGSGKFPKDVNMFTLKYSLGKTESYQVGITIGDMYCIKSEVDNALAIFEDIEKAELEQERLKYSKDSSNNDDEDTDEDEDDSSTDQADTSDDDEEDEDVPF